MFHVLLLFLFLTLPRIFAAPTCAEDLEGVSYRYSKIRDTYVRLIFEAGSSRLTSEELRTLAAGEDPLSLPETDSSEGVHIRDSLKKLRDVIEQEPDHDRIVRQLREELSGRLGLVGARDAQLREVLIRKRSDKKFPIEDLFDARLSKLISKVFPLPQSNEVILHIGQSIRKINLVDRSEMHFERFEGLGTDVRELRLNSDGKMLIAVSYENEAAIWDVNSGKIVDRFQIDDKQGNESFSVAISPDGVGYVVWSKPKWDSEDRRHFTAISPFKSERRSWLSKIFGREKVSVRSIKIWRKDKEPLVHWFNSALGRDGTLYLIGQTGDIWAWSFKEDSHVEWIGQSPTKSWRSTTMIDADGNTRLLFTKSGAVYSFNTKDRQFETMPIIGKNQTRSYELRTLASADWRYFVQWAPDMHEVWLHDTVYNSEHRIGLPNARPRSVSLSFDGRTVFLHYAEQGIYSITLDP